MLVYLFIVNALGFCIMLLDKYFAKHKMWRVPEATLFGLAVFGGSLGCICGMYTARHKTRHMGFVIGMPAILTTQIGVILWYYFRYGGAF